MQVLEIIPNKKWIFKEKGYAPFQYWYSENDVKFGKNAELATCPVRTQPTDDTPLESIFLNVNAKPHHVGNNRITDIVLLDPDFPTSFDELFYRLTHLFGEPEEKIEEKKEEKIAVPESKTIQNTSLLQDAQRICNSFRTGWEEYVNQKTETRNKLNFIREENIEIFLNKTVPLVAFDVYEMINILIKIEGIPERFFGDYISLKKNIDDETDLEQRVKHVRKLAMLLESKIPATIKFNHPKSIMPTINAKTSGSKDMDEFKSTRGQ